VAGGRSYGGRSGASHALQDALTARQHAPCNGERRGRPGPTAWCAQRTNATPHGRPGWPRASAAAPTSRTACRCASIVALSSKPVRPLLFDPAGIGVGSDWGAGERADHGDKSPCTAFKSKVLGTLARGLTFHPGLGGRAQNPVQGGRQVRTRTELNQQSPACVHVPPVDVRNDAARSTLAQRPNDRGWRMRRNLAPGRSKAGRTRSRQHRQSIYPRQAHEEARRGAPTRQGARKRGARRPPPRSEVVAV